MFPDSPDQWIIIAGAATAWIAAVISLKSAIYSRRIYQLANTIEEKRNALVNLYLNDSYFLIRNKYKDYHFNLLIKNISDEKNSIVKAELKIQFDNGSQPDSKIVVAYNENLNGENNCLFLPTALEVRQSVQSLMCFSVKLDRLKKPVKGYEIRLHDSKGNIFSLKPVIIAEKG